ncbi:MAG: glutamate--tRNA ligase [Acidilobaceae archaeon]|nr:glutamate--tRNA ligase [Acidilobaceae archaeon]
MSELRGLVKAYALKNAVKHGGKAKPESVLAMILGDHPHLRPHARQILELAREVAAEVNSMSQEEQKEALLREFPELAEEEKKREERRALQPLPKAEEGKVVLRFAPNPDFYIHLGNARPAILCDEYAKAYKGRMILRFEDTDPRTKTPIKEAYEAIREDLRWLGVVWHEEYVQSMRLEAYYSVAREMLRRGCAYIDLCKEEGKRMLAQGSYCPTRDKEPEWQLEHFDKMVEGHYREGEALLRIKTDPRHPNPSMRDWAAMRIIDTEKHPHPIVGSKYFVWPLYNFSVSVDDALMGVTHVIRGREHEVNTEKQLYVYKCMGWRPPVFIHTGRLKLEGFILSKSKIRELLSRRGSEFLGPDDPRFGTIASLRRRGILPETIRELILNVGIRENDATISWVNLAAANRALLDKRADRIMATLEPREVVYEGNCVDAEIPYHPDFPARKRRYKLCGGDRIFLNEGDLRLGEFRLMGAANVKVEGNKVVLVSRELEYALRKKLPVIQWVPAEGAVNVRVYVPQGLELRRLEGVAEMALREYGQDARLQLVRFGFVRVERAGESYELIFTHE